LRIFPTIASIPSAGTSISCNTKLPASASGGFGVRRERTDRGAGLHECLRLF
jgi:hypothetical protein